MPLPPRSPGPATIVKQSTVAGQAPKVGPANQAPAAPGPFPTVQSVSDPVQLVRYLTDLERRLASVQATANQGMFTGSNLVQRIAVTAGTQVTVAHQLGRPIKGRIVTNHTAETSTLGGWLSQAFTATGTYVATTTLVVVVGWGGGGGGGGGAGASTGTNTVAVGGSGGGGAQQQVALVATTVGTSYTVTLGAGGAGGAGGAAGLNGGHNASDGSSTTFGALATFKGGGGGLGGFTGFATADFNAYPGGTSVGGTPILAGNGAITTWQGASVQPQQGGWAGFASATPPTLPTAGGNCPNGQAGGAAGAAGGNSGSEHGGMGGGGGGAGPGGVNGNNGSGGLGGNGNNAGAGSSGTDTAGNVSSAARAVTTGNTGGGGGGGGAGGYGSATNGGAGGGGGGGDNGQATVWYPSPAPEPILNVTPPATLDATKFFVFMPLISGTVDILFF